MKTSSILSLLVAAGLTAGAAKAAPHNTAVSGGKLPKPVKVALVKVAGGFVDPVRVSLAPGDNNRLFVCERTGVVRVIKNGKVLDKPFLDIHDTVVSSFLEQGLYDLEFHPKYAENGKFYVHYSDMWFNGASFIVEYQVSKNNPDRADQETPRVVFQMSRPYANHNGGEIAFGPDGYLYIGSGDGGWEGDVLGAGQDLSTLLAKILRIDVNPGSADRGYSIPKDNPFITPASQMKLFGVSEEAFNKLHPNARPEIWSYGLRNPWTFQFDPRTGDMYIADIGQNHYEEVDFEPKGKGGVNYGWKFMCGTHPFPLPVDADGKPLLDAVKDAPRVGELPICEYSHVDQGNCVIGFGVYRGDKYPQMDGTYFFGDWGSGKVWGTARNGQGEWQMEELLNTRLMFTGGGQAPDGTLYVTDAKANYGGPADPARNERGSVWMLVPVDKVPAGAEVAPVE